MSIYNAMGFILKEFKDMLEIDMLRNSSQNPLGVLKGDFGGFQCSNDGHKLSWLRQ